MQYLIIAYDNEDVLEKRLESRDAHVANAKKMMQEGTLIQAAALIEDEKMVGSSLFVDFDSEDEIDKWLENEPYVVNGVWNVEEIQMVHVKLLPKD